jgi:hypothetical protein
MNNKILDNLKINKKWLAPGASRGIIIDGVYNKQNVIVKMGFIAGEDAKEVFDAYDVAFVYQLEAEREINEKIINNMDSPYVVKMIDSAFLEREYVDKYFKDELIKLEKQSTKAGMDYDLWWGYDFSKLVIMIFEKVENFTNLYNFKGNLKDWLDILWNVCQAYNIFNLYGLRHIDVNWSNILVIKNIECTSIKIIDYGTSTVQPTKLNNKIKIYNKSRDKEQNIKDLKYDLNDFVSVIKNTKSTKYVPLKIKKIIKSFKNKTPIQALKIIKNYK